jgi:hypothetical protein
VPPDLLSQLAGKPQLAYGLVSVGRTIVKPPTGATIKGDGAGATFWKYTGAAVSEGLAFLNAPLITGACITGSGPAPSTAVAPSPTDPPTYLNAGPSLTLSGMKGTLTLPGALSFGVFSYGATPDSLAANYLDPGVYTVTGAGGPDVGAFTTSLDLPPLLAWTNQESITSVDRASGLTITWTGGDPDSAVLIQGTSTIGAGTSSRAVGTFACLAPVSAGSFTVPSTVLLTLPASGTQPGGNPTSSLLVGSTVKPVVFQGSGIDFGIMTGSFSGTIIPAYK